MNGRALAAGLAVLAVLATPFQGGASPHGILLVHGLVLGLALLAVLLPAAGAAPVDRGAWSVLAVFALLVLLSAVRAPYGFAAWLAVQDVAVGLAVLFLSSRVAGGWPGWMPAVLLAAGACQGGIALAQVLGGNPRPAGTFLNPNHLAAWAGAVFLAGLPALRRGGMRRGVAASCAAGTLLAFVLGRSRGAVLGVLAGIAVLVVLRWARLTSRGRRALLAGGVAAMLLGGALFALRLREADPYRWTRTGIWGAALTVARGSPWLGCGAGQFATAAERVRFPDPVGPLRWDRTFSTPHSDLLRLPAEFGVPSLLAVLTGLGLLLRQAARTARREEEAARACALAGFAALAVQALVDDLSTRPGLVVLAAMLLGGAAALPGDGSPARVLPRAARLSFAVVLAVVFLAGDVAPWLAWRTLAGVPRSSVTAARLRRALTWNPVHPDTHLRLAEHALGVRPLRLDGYTAARVEAETAVRLSPEDGRYRMGVARVEATACQVLFRDEAARARATELYAAAEAQAPHAAAVPLEHGRFLLYAQDAAGALVAAERARALEPAAVAPRLLLARIHLALGGAKHVTEAEALLEEAEALAERYRDVPRESPYAASMLDLNRAEADALHRALQALR